MHVCACCLKEFHTRFLLNRHIATSTVCQHHFQTESLTQDVLRLRSEVASKDSMIRELLKANAILTRQFVENSKILNDMVLRSPATRPSTPPSVHTPPSVSVTPSQAHSLPSNPDVPQESVISLLGRMHP